MQQITKHEPEMWPDLPYELWKDTCQTLHLWTQIVGKVRLGFTPWVNHSWHVVLYLSERGLTTSPIHYRNVVLQLEFDLIDHVLWIRSSGGECRQVALRSQSVAEFYATVMATLAELGILVRISETPSEVP